MSDVIFGLLRLLGGKRCATCSNFIPVAGKGGPDGMCGLEEEDNCNVERNDVCDEWRRA